MKKETYIRYLSSWVRLNSKQDISSWNEQQLFDAFLLLPVSSVSLEQFATAVGDSINPNQDGIPLPGNFADMLKATFNKTKPEEPDAEPKP